MESDEQELDQQKDQQSTSGKHNGTGLLAISIALNMLNVPVKAMDIKRQLGVSGALSVSDIVKAAELCEVKAEAIKTNIKRLDSLPTPFVAWTEDEQFFVVSKVNEEQVLIREPLAKESRTLTIEEFNELWVEHVILLKPSNKAKAFDFGLHWFWPTLMQYKSAFHNVLIASLMIQIFALVTPLFTMIIIDKVLSTSGYNTLDVLAIGLAAMAIFDFIIGKLRHHVLSNLTNRMDAELMARLFKHLMRLPLSFFTSRRTGDTVSRVKELEVVRNFFSGPAVTSVIDFPFSFIFIGVMYWFSPTLTFVVVSAVILLILLYAVMGGKIRKRIREKSEVTSDNQSFLVEGISSVEMIKSLSVEANIQQQWEDQVVESSKTSMETEQLNNSLSQAAGFINKLTVAIALWLGARAVLQGEMTAGELIGFNMMISRVLAPAMRIAQLFQHIQQSQVSVQRIKDIFDATPECKEPNPAKGLPAIKGDVTFDHVSFAYDGERNILNDLNFSVKVGEVIGIVGISGSGKSTILKLLQRLYVPQHGRILVDGVNIAQIDPTWIRHQIGVVSQENILMNRSIRENIAITDTGLSTEKIEAAARLAGADSFIKALPEAYDTQVGERGAMLSMGQRQRIALARALVTNPRLLILDEATSSLDSEAEKTIQANMQHIVKGRTVFIVAHRLSTLTHVDKLMVIEQGRIIDFTTIDELKVKQGRYSKMAEAQTLENTQLNKNSQQPVFNV